MIYTTFRGASSLQAQELNELQEQLITQLTQYNNLIKNQYTNTSNINNLIVPTDPQSITTSVDENQNVTQLIENGWYLYKFNNMTYFIKLPEIEYYGTNNSFEDYILPKIKSRTISGNDINWNILNDTTVDTLNSVGSGRIQIHLIENFENDQMPVMSDPKTVTDYKVWALHWPTNYPNDMFFKGAKAARNYYSQGVTGQLPLGFGATFGHTIENEEGLEYKFKFLSVCPSMQAPPSTDNGWNGWNAPGDGYTYDSTETGAFSWNYFEKNIKKVPIDKRLVYGRPWEGGNLFASRWGYNDYYKNTTDGTSYDNLRYNTPWSDIATNDIKTSLASFLTKCKLDDLSFSYYTSNLEEPDLPWHFRKGFHVYNNNGATAHESLGSGFSNTSIIKSDARFISAIINDIRFKGKTLNNIDEPELTLYGFYSKAFNALKNKYNTLLGGGITLGVDDSLRPFTGITLADHKQISPSSFWTPYNGIVNNYRGNNELPFGYEYYHIVFPSLDYMLDVATWNNYHKKSYVDIFSELSSNSNLSVFQDIVSIQYNTYQINELESPFTKNGNDLAFYTNASRSSVIKNNSNAPVYYGLLENSMFASYLPKTNSTVSIGGQIYYLSDSKFNTNHPDFINFWFTRSGYIKGSTFDLEKYSFQGNLAGPTFYNQGNVLIGCSGCTLPTDSVLVRYPETFPSNIINTEKFYLELAFKHLTFNLIHIRSTHRSNPFLYKNYTPFITGFATSPAQYESLNIVWSYNKYTKLYWKELVWHLLMHGVNFFIYWDFEATANLGLYDLHLILNQWRTITNNSRVRPCNKMGDVSGSFNNDIVDRLILEEMYERCIISGGKILEGPMIGRYIWRVSVPPKYIKWNDNQTFGTVTGVLQIFGSDPVTKKLAIIGDGDISPISNFIRNNWGDSNGPADLDESGYVDATDQTLFGTLYDEENRLGFVVINPTGVKKAPTFTPEVPT